MATFFATLAYELHPDTPSDSRKLLRAELVGRRWLDRQDGALLPSHTVWMKRKVADELTTDDVHDACGKELLAAVGAVERMGRKISLIRAFIQVSGSGTYGLLRAGIEPESPEADTP